jgi:zinc transport system substrate-binding protein
VLRIDRRTVAAVTLLALTLIAGCSSSEAPDRPVVAVSVEPQAYFVEQIAGELVQVVVMVPPGANPATYSPTVHQIQALSDASLYFKVGHAGFAFERSWLDSMLEVKSGLVIVDGAQGSPCTAGDPHLWVAPSGVRVMAANLAKGLERLLPDQQEILQANLAAFQQRIDALDLEIRETLGEQTGRGFLVYHPSWGCFAEEYGLEQIAIERDGKEPSPHDLAAMIDSAKRDGIRVVFVQPQHSERAAETVAEAIGGRVVAVDPLARDWPANLRAVASALRASF